MEKNPPATTSARGQVAIFDLPMLRRLHISNYLLMEELDLPLSKGLTIITGETGSGKSIVIGALALAMGERADSNVLRDPGRRCVIELEMDLGALDLKPWFEAAELPYEAHTLIRRQLDPSGRSRAFINDVPVRVEQLKELGARLVHVHSQHHTLLLNDARFQLGLIDHLAAHMGKVGMYTEAFRHWRAIRLELSVLKEEAAKASAELDFLQFQLNELDEADLREDEQALLEQDLARAEHAEELTLALTTVAEGIEDERGGMAILLRLRQALARAARVDAAVNGLLQRLESVSIELKDIGAEAGDLASRMEIDPAAAERLRERLDLLLRLQQKHRVDDVAALITLREDLRGRVSGIGAMDERIPGLVAEEKAAHARVRDLAEALSEQRARSAVSLAQRVEGILHELGMEHAVFRFDHKVLPEPGPYGVDAVRAMFSANKDRVPAPLDKVASGGELSRVMLALISLAADSHDLPTVIFDEIDAGVSGEVADRVGGLMARMGADRQIIAITHLPQIASKAAHHLLVTKETVGDTVSSRMTMLGQKQRVEAIAQMLSGRELTKAALKNAQVLLKQR